MPSSSDPPFDYCPFCGMRLPPAGLDAHVAEYDDCAARLDAYGRGPTDEGLPLDTGGTGPGLQRVQAVVLAVIVTCVLGYSLLISQQLVLGVLASGIIVVAFLIGMRR